MREELPTEDFQVDPRHGGALKRIVQALMALYLVMCLAGAIRAEIAAWCAHEGTIDGYRKAESWDPANPAYPAAMARLRGARLETADARLMAGELEAATRLGTNRAFEWANLAEAYDRQGRTADAKKAYSRALGIFPKSPEINWDLANYLIRNGDVRGALAPLREALLGDESLRDGGFDVAWRAGADQVAILGMIPDRQDMLSAYLDYLVKTQRLNAAAEVWGRLAGSPEEIDKDAGFRYFDALRDAHRVDGMWTVWTDLAKHDRAKIHWTAGEANLIQNGSFEQPIVNGGFGWRVVPLEGAEIRVDMTEAQEGSRSLEIEFEGKENLEFGNVVQYVGVKPDTAYQFRAYAQRERITTDSGPRIAIYDPYDRAALSVETENLTGTAGWEEQSLDFRTGPKTQMIVVQVARPASKKLDNRIAGTIWLDDFSLTAEH
ncbi:MAG TPA: tetratricopeptide repeat protein [Candidatus Acidoferrales bacterium]|nr:tetratricopeptide repeat protein [Candidatus Acidoferrales bacterium]